MNLDTAESGDLPRRARYELPAPAVKLKDLHDKITDFLADDQVPIYLDTNVLSWMLRIGSEARGEFLDWCGSVERQGQGRRLHVPVWAAHELYRLLRVRGPLSDAKSALNRHRDGLQDLLTDISFQASVDRCGSDVQQFVSETLRDVTDLHAKLSRMCKDEAWYGAAESDIVSFVNERVLDSNVFDLIDEQLATADQRLSVRVPPGFNDLHKDSNRPGDLLLWKEVLRDASARTAKRFVLVTNDNKTDWSYVPLILDYQGNERGNDPLNGLHARIVHPTLALEARWARFEDILVINPALLAVALDRSAGEKVRALVAATHPPRVAPQSQVGIPWALLNPPPSNKELKRRVKASRKGQAPAAAPPSDDKNELSQELLEPLVKALRSNHAVNVQVLPFLAQLDGDVSERSSAFESLTMPDLIATMDQPTAALVGRRLFRAAATDDRLSSTLSAAVNRLSNSQIPAALELVAGLWAELYLDDELRPRPTPLKGPFEVLFRLSEDGAFANAWRAVLLLMGDARTALLQRPEGNAVKVSLAFVAKRIFGGSGKRLEQILCGPIELLCEMPPGDANTLCVIHGRENATVSEVLAVLAHRFTVPLAWLTPDIEFDTLLILPPELGLRLLRTDLGGVVDPTAGQAF